MNQKCHTLQGSSTTACSLKILCGERANEFGRTQRETERRQKFLRTIFAFITLETTKVIGRVLPSTNHLLFYDGPCDLSVASSCFDDTQISFFSSKNSEGHLIPLGTLSPKKKVKYFTFWICPNFVLFHLIPNWDIQEKVKYFTLFLCPKVSPKVEWDTYCTQKEMQVRQ